MNEEVVEGHDAFSGQSVQISLPLNSLNFPEGQALQSVPVESIVKPALQLNLSLVGHVAEVGQALHC